MNTCWVCGFYSRFAGVNYCNFGDTVEQILDIDSAKCDDFVSLGELDIEEDVDC